MENKSFSERLKRAIGTESVLSFSKRCGISDSLIRKYLTGSVPGLDNFLILVEATGSSLEWLATGKQSKPQRPTQNILELSSGLNTLNSQLLDMNSVIDEVMNDIEETFDNVPGLHQALNLQTRTLKRELQRVETTVEKLIEKNQQELHDTEASTSTHGKTDNDSHQVKQVFNGPVGKTIEGDSHQYGDFYMGSNKKK